MMHICLVTAAYPPHNTEGIPRQRQTLARELARLGQDVHVVTTGAFSYQYQDGGAWVHRAEVESANQFSPPGKWEKQLARAYALYQALRDSQQKYDIVDSPLWGAQGIAIQQLSSIPAVLWLQTTLQQILQLYHRLPSEEERLTLALEKLSLEQACGVLADSNSILEEVHSDYGLSASALTGVAHLGLPALPLDRQTKLDRQVQALVVGRLEKRKGTPFLFETLPALLRRYPRLMVRFVGRDNSQNDGWQAQQQVSYAEFFWREFPQFRERVCFEGYASEEQLAHFYRTADFLLAPSLYESFGLIYLEAMRAGLPTIAFNVGAAREVFAAGEAHGGLLTAPGESSLLEAAVGRLVDDPALRAQMGQAARQRFEAAFTAEKMAQTTLQFYQQVLETRSQPRPAGKIYQVMEALDEGDAVSAIALHLAGFQAQMAQPGEILTGYAHENVRRHTRPRHTLFDGLDSGLIFHYWGYSRSTWMLPLARGRKAIYYHNITPPEYFPPDSTAYRQTRRGYEQLPRVLDSFDLLMGDSRYDLECLAPYLTRPRPALHIYPMLERAALQSCPYDRALWQTLRRPGQVNLLFVGRIARNKRQGRLMEAFDAYYRLYNRQAQLWLVGNENSDPAYRAELAHLQRSLPAWENIHFTGKVSQAQLYAYYRAADVFLSASEHEGFGMPLVEAMAFDLPVLAYAAAAVPETLGDAGVLIHAWDALLVAGLVDALVQDARLKNTLLQGQRQNLLRFTPQEAAARLEAALEYLRGGEVNFMMHWQAPSPEAV